MRVLRRHYIIEFLKVLGILGVGISVLFSFLSLIDKVDDFVPGRTSPAKLLLFALLNMPKYLYYLLPMASLICCLFVFSQASRNRELIAVKATGGRLKRLFAPLIALGLLLSLTGFLLGEFVVPPCSAKWADLKSELTDREKKISFNQGTLWVRAGDGSLIRMGLYIPEKQFVKGMSIFVPGRSGIIRRIEAADAQWDDVKHAGKWMLRDVTVYDFEKGQVQHLSAMEYHELESPRVFAAGTENTDEMNISELYRYMRKLEAAGFGDAKLEVDFHSKISYPLTTFFIVILGAALSVTGKTGSGLFAAGLGLVISFVYWLLFTFMLSLGYAKVLPPAVATWIVPALFGILSIAMFRKIPE